MRKILEELGFRIDGDFNQLMGLMKAAHQQRRKNNKTNTQKITRSTALAVMIVKSKQVGAALTSLGLRFEEFRESIGLEPWVSSNPVRDINIHSSFNEALMRYSEAEDAVLESSVEVISIAILEDVVRNIETQKLQYELEERLRSFGLDIEGLSIALRSRSLPFDPRRQSSVSPDQTKAQPEPVPEEAAALKQEASELHQDSKGEPVQSFTPPEKEPKAEPKSTTDMQHGTAPFYSDHPAQIDHLNRKAVAETIATMIEAVWKEDDRNENIDRTFMVHLHGRWGSGKTSILNFLKDALLSNVPKKDKNGQTFFGPSWVIVDYNAWKNQKLGPVWWTLMENVYRQARNQLGGHSTISGLKFILLDRLWRLRSSYTPYFILAAFAAAIALWLLGYWNDEIFGKDKAWLADALKLISSILAIAATALTFGHNYRIGSARTAKSYMELSRDPLTPLIKRYGNLVEQTGRPVAVFIDDLDRCDAKFVVEILQTVQTLFRKAKVLYVVAADRDWVCSAYEQEYKTFGDTLGEPGKSLGHLFVEKVFQLSMEVPRLGDNERKSYWDGLINLGLSVDKEEQEEIGEEINAELAQASTEAAIFDIVDKYRDDPKRFDIAATKGFQRMHAAPLIKEREHFLAQYVDLIEPNPRAMKRLLNAYGFRRGFELQAQRRSDPDALVRWTILENRWPILTDFLEGRSSGRDETELVGALKNNADVLKVAEGLTWEKLKHVAAAPVEPPRPEITPGPDKEAITDQDQKRAS